MKLKVLKIVAASAAFIAWFALAQYVMTPKAPKPDKKHKNGPGAEKK